MNSLEQSRWYNFLLERGRKLRPPRIAEQDLDDELKAADLVVEIELRKAKRLINDYGVYDKWFLSLEERDLFELLFTRSWLRKDSPNVLTPLFNVRFDIKYQEALQGLSDLMSPDEVKTRENLLNRDAHLLSSDIVLHLDFREIRERVSQIASEYPIGLPNEFFPAG